MRARSIYAAVALAGVGLASIAVAQQAASKRPTLHEDLPDPTDKTNPLIGGDGSSMPVAIRSGSRILPTPTEDKSRTGEPVFGKSGFAADRKTTWQVDTPTGKDGALRYESVFQPDVVPFKRMSVLDAVGGDYKLGTRNTALVEVPVTGGKIDATREDTFTGFMLVQFERGKDIAIPSVAPDMRIVSYSTQPKLRVKFEKDGADNYYVRSDESNASGEVRLTFTVAAPAGYFAPGFPASGRFTPQIVATMAPPSIRVPLPDNVRAEALKTMKKLGIDPGTELQGTFNRMVSYFRAFEAKALTTQTGDIYRDLCDSQAGVCRHRAFAFMITSNALGIPTRYVENEAHAFAEVWFPERGWQRIDLGGAAVRLDVNGMKDRQPHKPRNEDPFAKPPAYTNNYSQLGGDVRGLSDDKIAERRDPDAKPSGTFDGIGAGSAGDQAGNDPTIVPGTGPDQFEEDPKKQKPTLEVTAADTSAFRGDSIHVEARVHVRGKPLTDHTVTVFLAPRGARGSNAITLGTAVTDADGMVRGDFQLPASLTLATYEIFLSSPPDAFYNPATSD